MNGSNGNWIWTNSCAYSNQGGHSAPGSAFFSGSGCQFGNGGWTTSGDLETPTVAIGASGAILTFNYLRVGEVVGFWDALSLQISNNGTTYTTVLHTNGGGGLAGFAAVTPTQSIVWQQACFNLSAYINQTITVRFNFNTLDGVANNYDGIYVDDITIMIPNQLSIWQSTNNVCPGAPVTLSTNAVGGFTWSTGAATPVIVVTPSVTTTYSINGCVGAGGGNGSLVVNVLPQLTLNVAPVNTGTQVCTGAPVVLGAGASGGVPGYSYIWQGSVPGNTYSALQQSQGVFTYTATVTDAASCSLSKTLSLSYILSPTLTNIPSQTICPGTTATISTSGANTFTWFPGGITSSSLTVSPSVQTTYSVVGTNTTTGCETTGTTTIFMKPTPSLSVVQASITCAALGFGTVTPVGGFGPFSYTWSPTNQTTAIANNLNTSTYTITVYDAATGCYTSTTTQYNPLTPLTAQLIHDTMLLCNGIANASAHFTNHANGSGSELYYWNNGVTTFTTSHPTTLNIGTWSVTLTDALTACYVYSVFTITQPPALTLNLSTSAFTTCAGSSVVLTGTTSGGTPGYSYSWVNGPALDTHTVVEINGSIYIYTLNSVDMNSCVASNTIAVDFVPNPVLNLNSVYICPLETATLMVSGANTYTWSDNSNANTLVASPPFTQQYTVTGSSAGCSTIATASIIIKPPPAAFALSNSPRCNGKSLNLSAYAGVGFTWNGPNGFVSAAQQPVIDPVGMANAGVYHVTVTAANNCTSSAVTTVVVHPTPTLSAMGSTVCSNGTLALFATAAPNSSYQWTGPVSFTSTQQNPTIVQPSVSHSGNYLLNLTSAEGCTASAIAHASVVPPPTLTANLSSHSLCSQAFNGSPNTITLTAGGAATYSLFTVPDMFNPNPGGPVSPLSAIPPNTGPASATLIGSNGVCTVSMSLSFSIIPNPTISLSSYTPVICAGQSFTYTNHGANSYTWSSATPGFTTYNNGGVAVANPSINSIFSVFGGSLGCYSASQTTTITVHPLPKITITPATSSVCVGSSNMLTAEGTATSFTWEPSIGLSTPSGSQVLAAPLAQQVYTVTGSANNCTSSATASITVLTLPKPAIVATRTMVCENESIQLVGQGGDPDNAGSYRWFGPDNFGQGGKTFTFIASYQHNATFTLTVSDKNNCTNSAMIPISVLQLPSGSLLGSGVQHCVPFCSDFRFQSAPGGEHISSFWTINGLTWKGKSFTQCFTTPGDHTIKGSLKDTVTGCLNTETFVVHALPVPKADFKWLPERIIEGEQEVQFLNTSVGEEQTSFNWFFIENNGYVSEQENTSYFFKDNGIYPVALIVKNSYGCSDTVVKAVRIEYDFAFYIPNAFTPNGDGLNDVFMPVTKSIKLYTMQVFNRWGELIFQTSDPYQGWDGSFKGERCAQGVYNWKITLSTLSGEAKTYMGQVSLLPSD